MRTSFGESILMNGPREQRALVALSMVDDRLQAEFFEDVFSSRIDWPWIFMQAMNHRTVCMMWESLRTKGLLDLAVRSGLGRNWIVYAEQLSRASLEKNILWLNHLERIFEAYEKADVASVCIKGSALIGDIYTPAVRMLGDIDTVIRQDDRGKVIEVLQGLGFQQGVIDPVSSTIKPLSREKLRFWHFNAHLMPKFTLETGDPRCPFVRFAAGFDFFDPHDEYSIPSDGVIDRRVARAAPSRLNTPSDVDTFLNLCVHVYREATSSTFAFLAENWHLWVFCDLMTFLYRHDSEALRMAALQRIEELGLRKPCYFAVHYAYEVYGDPLLAEWKSLVDPREDDAFLYELADGKRRIEYRRAFPERLFDTRQVVVPGLEPAWAKVMSDGEWW